MLDPASYSYEEFEQSVYAAGRAVTFDEFMTYQNARDDQESDELYRLRLASDELAQELAATDATEEELTAEIEELKLTVRSLEGELFNLENGIGQPQTD